MSQVLTEDEWGTWDSQGRPVFVGYKFDHGKSTYREEEIGEGGYVYAEPGMYTNTALLDIASMHPYSLIDENLLGNEYTARFKELLDARIAIKHGDFDKARSMLNGKLEKYLTDESSAKALSGALKTAVNSVYGLTAAHFDNAFRDPRNKDNIVAKRGALFMVNLKHEVQKRGYTVAHIKTDSIKIPNATPEIIQFVINYGKHYGYNFEHQATYDRMCLVNNAVYIAKTATPEQCEKLYGSDYIYSNSETLEDCKKHPGKWTATGAQFAVPYVFKTLFSKEDITFDDLCETKEVKTELYLDMNEDLPDVSGYEKEFAAAETKFKHGELSDTTFEKQCQNLVDYISEGHDYHYIGKVGQFCPIKKGCGGGLLMSKRGEKYNAVTGTKDWRWMESEMVKTLRKEDDINRLYFDNLVNDAVDAISKYGDFEWFISEDPAPPPIPPDFMNIPEDADEEVPF